MRKLIRGIAGIGGSLLIAGACGAVEIVVGQSVPLTGPAASAGTEMVTGVKIAIDAVNARGGINGHTLKHVVKDDGYKATETVRATKELIDKDNAMVLVGMYGTGNVTELLKQNVLSSAQIALVAPFTGGDGLRNPFNPWLFHIRASYGDETARMVRQILSNGLTRVGVLYQNDPFGQSGLAGVEKALAAHKLTIVSKGSYEKNTDDVAAAVKSIAEGKPQAVILVSVLRPAAAFLKSFHQVMPSAQAYSLSVVNGKELFEMAGSEAARGLGITQVVPSPTSLGTRISSEYLEALKRYAPGAKPSYNSFEEYIGARVLIEGLKKVKGAPTRQSILKAMEEVDVNFGGFSVAYNPKKRTGSQFVEVTMLGPDGNHVR